MLGSFNNWNIIKFINETTSSEGFDEVHKAVLDVISEKNGLPSIVRGV